MVDPVSALATASAAFGVLKKGFAVGRDIEQMAGDLGRWMSAMSDLSEAERQAKNPPIFKKLAFRGSVEEEAMQAFAAKKKAEDMRYELQQFISLTLGRSKWDELVRMEVEIRKSRKETIYKQAERRRKFVEWATIIIFGTVACGGFVWVVSLLYNWHHGL